MNGGREDRRRGPRRRPDARSVALAVLTRVRESDAYANLVLPAEVDRAGLGPREAAVATELAYGTLRMLGTLDWVVSLHADRSIDEVDPDLLDVLRLGTYQLLYSRIPVHAAVSETVDLVRRKGARGFANAILRRVAEGREEIPWPSPEGDLPTYLRVRYAHPDWIVRLWLSELGRQDTEGLLRADNEPPGVSLRVNTLRTGVDELAGRLRAAGLAVEEARTPDVLRVRGGGAPASWPGWDEGLFAVQDEASVLAAAALRPDDAGMVVDLCAGPGGKTGGLAAEGEGRLVGVELHAHRARLVGETLARLGTRRRTLVVQGDGTRPPIRRGVDAVLVDAPCSGLGVLRRRPEARWRVKATDVERCAELQLDLLRSGFSLLRTGGALVYAVCTVTRAETTGLLERFLGAEADAEPEALPDPLARISDAAGSVQLMPHVHGTDGMFIARVRRIRGGDR